MSFTTVKNNHYLSTFYAFDISGSALTMELHSNLYFKHPNPEIMNKLDRLFQEHQGNAEIFKQIAITINPTEGEEFAQDLIDQIDQVEYDLGPESLYRFEGYSIAHFVHGSSGDEFMEAILNFLKSLVPDIHTQAWGCGDDDPWEFWFKFEGDELIREDDEPFNDPDEDQQIQSSIYAWWHKDMPKEIQEGFLNDPNYISEEE